MTPEEADELIDQMAERMKDAEVNWMVKPFLKDEDLRCLAAAALGIKTRRKS